MRYQPAHVTPGTSRCSNNAGVPKWLNATWCSGSARSGQRRWPSRPARAVAGRSAGTAALAEDEQRHYTSIWVGGRKARNGVIRAAPSRQTGQRERERQQFADQGDGSAEVIRNVSKPGKGRQYRARTVTIATPPRPRLITMDAGQRVLPHLAGNPNSRSVAIEIAREMAVNGTESTSMPN